MTWDQQGRVWRRTGAILVMASLASCGRLPVPSSPSTVEWPPDLRLPQAEKQQILALARMMGVAEPAKVSVGVVLILGDRFVTVDGRVSSNGPHRSWSRARMFREDWRGPDDAPPPELRKYRVGRWISMGDGEKASLWRIEDGSWSVDVSPPGDGVSLADARQMVLALRHGTYLRGTVDEDAVRWVLATMAPAKVITIASTPNGTYSVGWSTGDDTGCVVELTLADGAVKLLSAYSYIV